MHIDAVEIKFWLEVLSYVSVILGIPIGLFRMSRTAKREQLDREYGTYNALDEKYLEFLGLCFDHPHLDIFELRDSAASELTPIQKKQELIAFSMLFSIMERAYLMYSDQTSDIKKRQWSGWQNYLIDYCGRVNFRAAWQVCGDQFDTRFVNYVSTFLGHPEGLRQVPDSQSTDQQLS